MGESDSIFSSGRGKVQAWNGNTEASETMPEAGSYAPTDQYASERRGGRRARAAKASTPSPVSAGPVAQPAQPVQKKKGNKGCLIAVIIILVLMFIGPLISTGVSFLGVFLDDVLESDDGSSDGSDYTYSDYAELSDEDEQAVAAAAEDSMRSIAEGDYGDLAADYDYALYQNTDVSFEMVDASSEDMADWALQDLSYELSYIDSDEGCVTATYEVTHRSFYDKVLDPYWEANYSSFNERVEGVSHIIDVALDDTETTTTYVDIDLVKNEDGEWVVLQPSVEYAYRTLFDLR